MRNLIFIMLFQSALLAQYVQSGAGGGIPDNSFVGFSSTISIDQSILVDKGIQVSLSLTAGHDGGFSGDLYAILVHEGTDVQSAVLLNRPGRDTSRPFGYNDGAPIEVTFSFDAAAGRDVHRYQEFTDTGLPAKLAGIWEADGRRANPLDVVASSSRDSNLEMFKNVDGIGNWTLFIADLGSGGTWKLNEWKLAVVPEANSLFPVVGLLCLVVGFGARIRRRGASSTFGEKEKVTDS